MVYRIYKIINSELKDGDNYHQRVILEEIDDPNIQMDWITMKGAVEEIARNSEKLTSTELTILPVISVSYDGQIC